MVYTIAEIGINHNGDLSIARDLINAATEAGCNAVKFQKRTVDVVYTPEELARPRENPFGPTNGDLKRGLEFGKDEYDEIDGLCKKNGINWFASCWDEESVDFIVQYEVPYFKIASPSLTDDDLLRYTVSKGKSIIASTGMSTLDQIDHAVNTIGKDRLVCLMHCTSTYPSKPNEQNLLCVPMLERRYGVTVGFSNHSPGITYLLAAVALGVKFLEFHITLDRSMWGSDQAASIEPPGVQRIVSRAMDIEVALGDGIKTVYGSEKPIIEKLRRK